MTAPTRTPPLYQNAPPRRIRSLIDERIFGLPIWVVITQLFLGLGWLRAAVEKLISTGWWRGDVIRMFLIDRQDQTLGWYQPFVDLVVSPLAAVVAAVVLVSQAAIGLSFLSGRFVGPALLAGMLLNLHFIAAGAVNPSAFYLVMQGAIALWLAERTVAERRTSRILVATAALGAVLAALSLPFISTVDPHGVIEDPWP